MRHEYAGDTVCAGHRPELVVSFLYCCESWRWIIVSTFYCCAWRCYCFDSNYTGIFGNSCYRNFLFSECTAVPWVVIIWIPDVGLLLRKRSRRTPLEIESIKGPSSSLNFFSSPQSNYHKPAKSIWIPSRTFLFLLLSPLTTKVEEAATLLTASSSKTQALLRRPRTRKAEEGAILLTAPLLERALPKLLKFAFSHVGIYFFHPSIEC